MGPVAQVMGLAMRQNGIKTMRSERFFNMRPLKQYGGNEDRCRPTVEPGLRAVPG